MKKILTCYVNIAACDIFTKHWNRYWKITMMMTILYCCLGDPFDLGQLENVQVIESAQLGDIRGRRVHRLGVRDVVAVAHAHPGSLAGPELAPARPGTVKLSTITIKTKKE